MAEAGHDVTVDDIGDLAEAGNRQRSSRLARGAGAAAGRGGTGSGREGRSRDTARLAADLWLAVNGTAPERPI